MNTTTEAITTLPSLPAEFTDSKLLELFESVKAQVNEVPDVETEEGRKRIRDNARKVSSSKAAIDKPMRDYLREIKSLPKIVEKAARENVQRFDDLKLELLKPLEEAQASQDAIFEFLGAVPLTCSDSTSEEVKQTIAKIETLDESAIWPELQKKFKQAYDVALTTANLTLERTEKEEAQERELEELRKLKSQKEQDERDRQIREEAAKLAQQQAEEKARKEREDIERRAVEAKQREEDAKAAEQKAMRDTELAEQRRIEQAEADKLAAIEAKKQADINAKLAAEKAVEDERKRIADEDEKQKEDAKRREADKENRMKINRAALVDLIAAGVEEQAAKDCITAIAKGQVRNMKIFY
jgi:hypothetical protein